MAYSLNYNLRKYSKVTFVTLSAAPKNVRPRTYQHALKKTRKTHNLPGKGDALVPSTLIYLLT